MSLVVTSWAFSLEDLPVEFTVDGTNISPPLEWTPGPEGTKSYALIFDDPDGPRGIWVHWVAWNIRDAKLQHGWNETARWNVADNKLLLGPEYAVDQEGTEVLLARVRLPAAGDPPEYDVQGEIEVDNAVRVLSYTTFELSWLLRAT